MQIDQSAARRYLAHLDGDASLDTIWNHPAYDVARAHADQLGRDLSAEDLVGETADRRTTADTDESVADRRDRIVELVDHVRDRESAWTDRIDDHLHRVTPDEDLSDVTCYLGLGYEMGIGLGEGAYVNLLEPLYHEDPRELLAVISHECSHVVYDRVHEFSDDIGPEHFESPSGQRRIFETVFHTEAYATYTPLQFRRSAGLVGGEHPICVDYRVIEDGEQLRELVAAYDSFLDRLGEDPVSQKTLFGKLFGGSRLPYRVGSVMVRGIEEREGKEGVEEAFYVDPGAFVEDYDWVLDEYRE